MSEKKPDLFACIDCGMYGTKDCFTLESNDKCNKCSRLCKLEQSECSEKSSLEKSFESLTIRVTALEGTSSQKNDGERPEEGKGNMDREDAVHEQEAGSSKEPKEQKPAQEVIVIVD